MTEQRNSRSPLAEISGAKFSEVTRIRPAKVSRGAGNRRRNRVVINQRVTLEEIVTASETLIRFFEEYQDVDRRNSDSIVEYKHKRQTIFDILKIKRFDGLTEYSLIDLIDAKSLRFYKLEMKLKTA